MTLIYNCDSVIDVLKGLLTPTIGVIAIFIAWQQLKTNKDKLRLDLYNRRFEIYESLMKFLAGIAQMGDVDNKELQKFLIDTKEAIFLFEKDIYDYLQLIYKTSLDLQSYERKIRIQQLLPTEREKLFDKRAEVFSWLTKQLTDARIKFYKYLQFEKAV